MLITFLCSEDNWVLHMLSEMARGRDLSFQISLLAGTALWWALFMLLKKEGDSFLPLTGFTNPQTQQ